MRINYKKKKEKLIDLNCFKFLNYNRAKQKFRMIENQEMNEDDNS